MIYTKILKTQRMTYSMILSYLRYKRFLINLDKTGSDKLKTCMQARFMSSYSNRGQGYKHSVLANKPKKTDVQQNYDDMMKFLSVTAKAEEERIALARSNKMKLKESVCIEVRLTGIPAVIRALKPAMYMNKYNSFSGVLYYPTPVEWFGEIEQPVTTSKAYDSLCFKLQAPYNLVTGFCGRQALLNLCELTKRGTSVYSVWKDNRAVDEIFDVATQQVLMFTKEDILKLVLFRFNLRDFSKNCYDSVFSHFMRMINDDKYSVNELHDFTGLLSLVDKNILTHNENKEFAKVIKNVWNHISYRPHSISLSMLAELYSTAPSDHKKIFPVLNKVLTDNMDLMNVCDVFMILKEIHSRADSQEEVTLVKNWLERNFDALTVTDIETLLTRFIESHYVNPFFLKILPLLIASESVMKDLSTNLVVLILTYCMMGLHYDGIVLETACNQYIEDTKGYTSEQLNCLLKAIGTFNFVPYRQQAFFSKVELHLMENFYNIDVLMVLEMFVHLIYINKVAVNFRPYIFAPLFLGIVNEMPDEERIRGTKFLQIIESAFTSRNFKPKLTLPADPKIEQVTTDTGPVDFIQAVFAKLLRGESQIQVKRTPTWSGHYLEVQHSALAQKAGRKANFKKNDKFAFLVLTKDSYSNNNNNHMLGHEVTNIRLLQEQGLNVYSAHIDQLRELKEKNKLDGFVESLFLQIIDSAQECLSGSDEDEDTVDGVTRSGEDNEEEDIDDF